MGPRVVAMSMLCVLAACSGEDATPGHETFRARAVGSMIATRTLDAVELDLDGNTVEAVTAGKRTSALTAATFERHGDKLVVKLPAPARKGDAILIDVRYRGAFAQADGANPNDFSSFGGLMVRQHNAEGKRIFASLAWPSKARRFIPLRDHPRDGAMIAMNVAFPASFSVVANGEQKSVVAAGASRTWAYEALTPMPPYD